MIRCRWPTRGTQSKRPEQSPELLGPAGSVRWTRAAVRQPYRTKRCGSCWFRWMNSRPSRADDRVARDDGYWWPLTASANVLEAGRISRGRVVAGRADNGPIRSRSQRWPGTAARREPLWPQTVQALRPRLFLHMSRNDLGASTHEVEAPSSVALTNRVALGSECASAFPNSDWTKRHH
jgi:hypothetical protein